MNYLSICSGIEAASVAWEPLGWKPVGFAEIEPFCRALLKHYWPGVRNHGDFTKLSGMFIPAADLLVAGTPCQDFSVAGLRAGLDGVRGNLTLEWLALVERTRFRWLVWENVPGVLSLDEGRVFGLILSRLAELGYGFAYRILDAQHFGVPQRRRRIFLVGYLGDWRPAAAVLFERSSLLWNSAPSRPAREESAGTLGGGTGERGWCDDTDRATLVADPLTANEGHTWSHAGKGHRTHNVIPDLSHAVRPRQESKCNDADRIDYVPEFVRTLDASYARLQGASNQDLNHNLSHLIAYGGNRQSGHTDVSTAVTAHGSYRSDFETDTVLVAHTLRADGFDASEDGTGRGAPLVLDRQTTHALANLGRNITEDGTSRGLPIIPILEANGDRRNDKRDGLGIGDEGDPMFTLQAGKQHAVAFRENQQSEIYESDKVSLHTGGGKPGQGYPAIVSFRTNQTSAQGPIHSEEVTDTLAQDHPPAVAFKENQRAEVTEDDTAALTNGGGKPGQGYPAILSFTERSRPDGRNLEFQEDTAYALTNPGSGGRTHSRQLLHEARVRRLTPIECERLQGFPDNYTRIVYRGKIAADGPRYRALGNSMAVPVMRWIGKRIQVVEELLIKAGDRRNAP